MSDDDHGCRRYRPGHAVHHIQARKAFEDARRAAPATVTAGEGTLILLDTAGEARRYRNHTPSLVADEIERRGRRALLQERWSILAFVTEEGWKVFSIAPADQPWTPCAARDLLERR